VLEVTTTGSRSQALGEVRLRLVEVFLWQLFPDSLQGNFQPIICLRLRLEFSLGYFFSMAPQTWYSRASSNGESFGPLVLVNGDILLAASCAGHLNAEKGGGLFWFKYHSCVIFRWISTKLGDKVYISLFNSCVNIMQDVHTLRHINKSHRGLLFFTDSPGIYNLMLLWKCIFGPSCIFLVSI